MQKPNLLLVGYGKMGGALLARLAPEDYTHTVIVDPNSSAPPLKEGMSVVQTPDDLPKEFRPDVIVLAIKPQTIPVALPHYCRFTDAVFLSIAAGVTLKKLADLLGLPTASIIRAMPNLPASIGLSATGAAKNAYVTESQTLLCTQILSRFGTVEWLDYENSLDAVTALSGSGPAYVFALCEAMTAAGVKLGLPQALSERLARQTLIGSSALLNSSSDTPTTLRQNVTSPNGTTAAALDLLIGSGRLHELLEQAMSAAADRSRQLAR